MSGGLVEERKILVPADERVSFVSQEFREVFVPEVRAHLTLVPHEDRDVMVAGEDRTVLVPCE